MNASLKLDIPNFLATLDAMAPEAPAKPVQGRTFSGGMVVLTVAPELAHAIHMGLLERATMCESMIKMAEEFPDCMKADHWRGQLADARQALAMFGQ